MTVVRVTTVAVAAVATNRTVMAVAAAVSTAYFKLTTQSVFVSMFVSWH